MTDHEARARRMEEVIRGSETIGVKWSWAVQTLGSHWTVDEIICDPATDRAGFPYAERGYAASD